MPADPAAPVTEPRAELVEAAARALLRFEGYEQEFIDALPPDEEAFGTTLLPSRRDHIRALLPKLLPLLTLADLPAALLDVHEQQIRAKVAEEIEAEKRRAVDRAPGWFAGMANAEHIAARGTEGGTR